MVTTGALSGIKVLDLSRVLGGPYCTQALADHGAEVIKLEPLTGDETRFWGPPFEGDIASYFQGINRNKKGIALDLSTPEGKEVLFTLLEQSDVLVENFKPGTLERWGLGFEEVISKRFPKLIHCAVSGFGSTGPLGGLPGYDAIIQSMGGLMSVNGNEQSGPMRVGLPIVDIVTGLNALVGILLALNERQHSGLGQFIDVTLFDCGLSLLHPHVPNFLASGQQPKLTGNSHPNIVPYDTYHTSTDDIFLAIGNDRQFSIFCKHIDAEHLSTDERFINNKQRSVYRNELKPLLENYLIQHDGNLLADQLMRLGVPCGVVASVKSVVEHEHTKHRQMIQKIDDYQGIASPIKLSRTPAQYKTKPPQLGQDTLEVLKAHGLSDETIQSLESKGVILPIKK